MHRECLLRGEIIEHDVGVDARIDLVQEPDEVLGPMLRFAPRDGPGHL